MVHSHLFLTLLITTLFLHIVRAKVPAIIVFGDSSVDTGNNNQLSTLLKSNFLPYGRDFIGRKATGRFSNGRLPPDFISEAFGCKPIIPAYLDPSYSIKDFATGVCFASAGTGYDNATSSVLDVMPLWKEMEYYKEYQKRLRAYIGVGKANVIFREALYLMSLGTNDFLENYYAMGSRRASQFTVSQFQDFLIGLAGKFIGELHSLGVRKLSLTGLPPMGCLPLERTTYAFVGTGCNEEYNKVAIDFNRKLNGMVVGLNRALPGMQLVNADAFGFFLDIIQRPARYGFENAEVACCGTGFFEMGYLCNEYSPFTCADANKYVFWDSFHPTQRLSQIVANYVVRKYLTRFM